MSESQETLYIAKAYERIDDREHKLYVGDYLVITYGGEQAQINYLHKDRLGSVVGISNTASAFSSTRGFNPYGDPRGGEWSENNQDLEGDELTTRGFTGHEHLERLGLIHMNGRIFNPGLGRFLSPDPIIQFPLNGQSWNAYSYLLNNPMSGTDPSGFTGEFDDDDDGRRIACGFVCGPPIGVYGNTSAWFDQVYFDFPSFVENENRIGRDGLGNVLVSDIGTQIVSDDVTSNITSEHRAVFGGPVANFTARNCGSHGLGAVACQSGGKLVDLVLSGAGYLGAGVEGIFRRDQWAVRNRYTGEYLSPGQLMDAKVEAFVTIVTAGLEGVIIQFEKAFVRGLALDARFAQRTFRNRFSDDGITELRRIAGMRIETVDDLADAIRSGAVEPSSIPVNIIVRDGNTLILNTRTVQALEQAGIHRSDFNVIDRTGDEFFESLLSGQLNRNNLTNDGIDVVRRTGN